MVIKMDSSRGMNSATPRSGLDAQHPIKNSLAAYDQKYEGGYGLQYPDGHIIRIFERILKYELGVTTGNLLDFGCGNGVHSKYFMSKGFQCYGVDIAKEAICQAKTFMHEKAVLIKPNQSLKEIFQPDYFDVVLANQSLYYMDDADMSNCIKELYTFTKPGGICIFTMMSARNCYNGLIEETYDNGLSKVVLRNRLTETTYINFIENEEQLKSKFSPFQMLRIGYYDFGFISEDPEEGSSHHFIFIGKKEKV